MSTDDAVRTRRSTPTPVRNDGAIRAFRDDVMAHLEDGRMVDVRSPQEFSGELLHMPDYPQEGALRGGTFREPANALEARRQ